MKNFKQKGTTIKHNESYRKLRSKKGFSLVELLVVIGIMGLLISVAIPSYTKYTTNATFTAIKSSLISIKKAFEICVFQNGFNNNCTSYSALKIPVESGVHGESTYISTSASRQCFIITIKGKSGCVDFDINGFKNISSETQITDSTAAVCSSGSCTSY